MIGPVKTGPASAPRKIAGELDVVFSRQLGRETPDGDVATLRGEREAEIAHEVAAQIRLLDGDSKRRLAERPRLGSTCVGKRLQGSGGRSLLVLIDSGKQRVDIDPAGGKLPFAPWAQDQSRA